MYKTNIKKTNQKEPASLIKKSCVILFLKYPEEGQIKTRLSHHIGEKLTTDLYKMFVADILETLSQTSRYELIIFFYPQNAKENILHWLGKKYSYFPQKGDDLGERMKNAFNQVFSSGINKTVIIGSDVPDLPESYITHAFEALDNHDAVIGPSVDGGYYLIGFRSDTFMPSVFKKVSWGTDKVLLQTKKRFKKSHKVRLLPFWSDIDRIEDIKVLLERSRDTPFETSRTISFIKNNKEILNHL